MAPDLRGRGRGRGRDLGVPPRHPRHCGGGSACGDWVGDPGQRRPGGGGRDRPGPWPPGLCLGLGLVARSDLVADVLGHVGRNSPGLRARSRVPCRVVEDVAGSPSPP